MESKILIFGGTTEGRRAAALCDTEGKPFYYSTKSTLSEKEFVNAILLSGGFEFESLSEFCSKEGITLMIDAAHPFAERLHSTAFEVAKSLKIPLIRYERLYPERMDEFCYVSGFERVVDLLAAEKYNKVLMLTGVNSIAKTKRYWQEQNNCYFRILKRDESVNIAAACGLPEDRVLFYDPISGGDMTREIEMLCPDVIVTKESGFSGFFEEKSNSSKKFSIPMIVVSRPELPIADFTVYGPEMLRKQIERAAPDFFHHKTGFTTGSCATAATAAAIKMLINGSASDRVEIRLPSGEPVVLDVMEREVIMDDDGNVVEVSYSVIKFAGDDPDVTDGMEIVSTVRLNDLGKIRFCGGEGVGRITLPGLDAPVGEAAINNVPKEMMKAAISKFVPDYQGVDVKISVPGGEKIALRTFNPRLGIVGGISIIGTSGIVRPFSNEAFIDSIRKEMSVAKALGIEVLVINSGAKSESAIKSLYPDLQGQAFIHYGNFIGKTLEMAEEMGFREVVMGIMIGKAVKLAEGHLDTHSKNQTMNRAFLTEIARKAGCPEETIVQIGSITMARNLLNIIPQEHSAQFFSLITECCHRVATSIFKRGKLEIVLIRD